MSKVGIKADDGTVNKGVIRIQKLLDELRREVETLKERVTTLGG